MEEKDLTALLLEKMQAEQDQFKGWLLKQPPEEILRNAYQYTVKEDILFSFDALELPDEQARALLSSPAPLDDVYKEFLKRETGYMDILRDCVEERAKEVIRAREALRSLPIYLNSAAYAQEHGEDEQYRASHRANIECREAIEQAISDHYGDNRLDTASAFAQVLERFGEERMKFVLATTIREKQHDGRISRAHKDWAQTIPTSEDRQRFYFVVDKCNPGLVDLFVTRARKEFDREEGEKKPSVLGKLQQQQTAAPKPPAPGKKKAQER